MLPASGSISRSTSRLTVDLPQPDSPTSASVLPASTVKLTPSTALIWAVGRPSSDAIGDEMFFQAFDFEQGGHDTSPSSGVLDAARPVRRGSTATIGGGAATQASITNGQRAAKRQPGGGLAMFGTMPSMVARCEARRSSRGIEPSRPTV